MRALKFAASLSVIMCAVSPAAWGLEDLCRDVLIPARVETNWNLRQKLSYLDMVDYMNWRDKGRSFAQNAEAIVEGIPFKAAQSYDEFERLREQYKRTINYQTSHDESSTYAASYLQPDSVKSWTHCMHTKAKEPLVLRMKDLSDERVTIEVSWEPHPLMEKKPSVTPTALHGSFEGPVPKELGHGVHLWSFTRTDKTKDFVLTVKVSGPDGAAYTKLIKVPAERPIFVRRCEIPISFDNLQPKASTREYFCHHMEPNEEARAYFEGRVELVKVGGGCATVQVRVDANGVIGDPNGSRNQLPSGVPDAVKYHFSDVRTHVKAPMQVDAKGLVRASITSLSSSCMENHEAVRTAEFGKPKPGLLVVETLKR